MRIAAARQALTDRAGRWVTLQVGGNGRSVAEVADKLGCAWHTVNTAVIAYGEALVNNDPERIGTVTALGLDDVVLQDRPISSSELVDVDRRCGGCEAARCGRRSHRCRALRLVGPEGTGSSPAWWCNSARAGVSARRG